MTNPPVSVLGCGPAVGSLEASVGGSGGEPSCGGWSWPIEGRMHHESSIMDNPTLNRCFIETKRLEHGPGRRGRHGADNTTTPVHHNPGLSFTSLPSIAAGRLQPC